MSYQKCPQCSSLNRAHDTRCYNCDQSMSAPKTIAADHDSETRSDGAITDSNSAMTAFVSVVLASALGAGLGFGIEHFAVELPFLLEELLLGLICALTTTFLIGKFLDLPEGFLAPRVLPSAVYGLAVGFCLFCFWWAFDPAVGFVAIGAIAGACSGLPVAVSFGLCGGESRPFGMLEFSNVVVGFAMGFGLGAFLGLDSDFTGPLEFGVGLGGALGLLPCIFGGRLNLWEYYLTMQAWSERNS